MVQNHRLNGPKCSHVGSKNEARRGAPSTFRGHFEVFEVLSGLGRSGRGLRAVLHGSWAVYQGS